MLFVLLVALALSGCTSPTPTVTPTAAPTATPTPGPVALTVNGSVATPLSLTLADLRTYAQLSVNETTTNSKNVTSTVTGTGPSLNAILTRASPSATARNITFIGSDGYAKTILLSVPQGSANATVIILSDNTLRDIIPGQGAGAWVGNLTTITIS
jgi:hypothetical protein